MMKYNKLGASTIDVSVLALGCWPFAGGKVWGAQDDRVSMATVHAALDAGINFFDTAEGYENGHSERVLGQGLEGRRNEAVIATKVSGGHLSAEGVVKACENSLKNLRTDFIDLYQIHWPNWKIPLSETLGALERLREQGKVRLTGVCNFGSKDLKDLSDMGPVASNQLPFSLLWRVIEREIQPLCLSRSIGILCYSPLMQGLLTGRYASADEVPEGLARTRLFSKDRPMSGHGEAGCEAEVFGALAAIGSIARELHTSMATVALSWVRQQAGVTSLLVGARNPEEVQWNLPAVDYSLSPEAILRLSEVTEEVKERLGHNADMWVTPSRMR